MQTQLLFEDDIFFAAPVGSPYAHLAEVDLGAMARENFVSLGEGFATYGGFIESFRVAGFTPNVVMKTDDIDRKSTRLNSSHQIISYAVFCLKKKNTIVY